MTLALTACNVCLLCIAEDRSGSIFLWIFATLETLPSSCIYGQS